MIMHIFIGKYDTDWPTERATWAPGQPDTVVPLGFDFDGRLGAKSVRWRIGVYGNPNTPYIEMNEDFTRVRVYE